MRSLSFSSLQSRCLPRQPFCPQEKLHASAEEIEATFLRAITSGLFSQDMDATVALYHARASYYRRESEVEGAFLGV